MPTPQQLHALIAEGIRTGQYPSRLYKYRKFDHNTDSLFVDHHLYFSNPSAFNDPFDCQIHDNHHYTRDEIFRYLRSRDVDPAQAGLLADSHQRDPSLFQTLLAQVKEMVIGSKGILSLSERPDDILMWSHYSESHTGFVMGFDVPRDIPFFTTPFRVNYSGSYPAYAYLIESDKILSHGMMTKSDHWSYEQEVRILKNNQGLHPFDKASLVEVILGARTTNANSTRVQQLLNNNGYAHVAVRQASVSRTNYAIDIA